MNTLNRLSKVITQQKRYIATVLTVNTNGTTTVMHSDGAKEVVLGNSITSGKVYIRDGIIVGQAANLNYIEIDV